MSVSARRFALRDQTRTNHESLDSMVGGLTDRATYVRYLRGMALFRAHVDVLLQEASWPEDGPARPAALGTALYADLADLALTPDVFPLPDIPLDSASSWFGAVYVLEGSALGAKLLRRQAEALGFDGAFGARHLAAQTDAGTWPLFLAALDKLSPYDEAQSIAAARSTFACARAAFRAIDAA